MNIQWTDEALAEYAAILENAAQRNILEATNIEAQVQRVERNIATFPKAAAHNNAHNYYERFVPRTRIILVYKLAAPDVIIIAAFHTSRDVASKP